MHDKRYAFSTGALYPLESNDALTLVGQAGFGHAELMPQAFGDISDDAIQRYAKCDVHISSIHYPLALFSMLYSGHQSMAQEGRAYSAKLVKFAHRMGTEVIVIHPTFAYEGDLKEIIEPQVLGNIRYLYDLCEENSITLAMENYPVGVGQYPETLEAYITSLNMPGIQPMVDTTEVVEGGGEPADFIQKLSVAPCHLHLSDFKEGKKHLPPGLGAIAWEHVFVALRAKSYKGYYTLEPSYRYYLKDVAKKLERDFAFISSMV